MHLLLCLIPAPRSLHWSVHARLRGPAARCWGSFSADQGLEMSGNLRKKNQLIVLASGDSIFSVSLLLPLTTKHHSDVSETYGLELINFLPFGCWIQTSLPWENSVLRKQLQKILLEMHGMWFPGIRAGNSLYFHKCFIGLKQSIQL